MESSALGERGCGLDQLRFPGDDEVYAHVRERVLSRVYPPGDVIVLDDLAWELGVGHSTLVYALTRLACEGHVLRDPELGYVVSEVDLHTVEETFDARLAIELGAIELSIDRVSVSDLADLRIRCEEMASLLVDGSLSDVRAYLEASQDFHERLVALAGSDALTNAFQELSGRILVTRAFGFAPDSARQSVAAQRGIVEALQAADVVAARAAVHQYCAAAKQRMRGILRLTGDRL